MAAGGRLHDADRLGLAGFGLTFGGAAAEHRGFGPAFVDGGIGRHGHRLGLLARDFQHRGQHAGVRALALEQRAEDHPHDVRALAEELARHRSRLGGGELQQHAQVVGQLGRAEEQDQIGQVTGLAWTQVGGELLTVEAVQLPGKGKVVTASGASVAVDLQPGSGGALLSLAAYRALGLALTDLPEVTVFME